MSESDETLVSRAKSGDNSAFETLLRRHFRAAFLVAMAQLGERSDAEDACQDAFVRCWERIGDCREGDRFAQWMVRVVRNTAHNHREYLDRRSGPALHENHIADQTSPHGHTERRELRDQLWRALIQLGERQREVVLMHDLEGWPHADIADRLAISEAMSRRLLSDARKILRSLLRDTMNSSQD
jgi:RNA polymerase sigma-70 factor (ECF subfamily)